MPVADNATVTSVERTAVSRKVVNMMISSRRFHLRRKHCPWL